MSQSNDLIDIKVAIGVLKEQNATILKRQESMEKKIDGFAFVKVEDFDKFKEEIKTTYATKDEVSPMKKFFYSGLSAIAVALVTFWLWVKQGGGQ